jgi:hypothetical protein
MIYLMAYDDFKFLSHIARFDEAGQEIEYHGQEKKDICCDAPISKIFVQVL